MHLSRTIAGCRCLFLTSFKEPISHVSITYSTAPPDAARRGGRSPSRDHPAQPRAHPTAPPAPPGRDPLYICTGLSTAWAFLTPAAHPCDAAGSAGGTGAPLDPCRSAAVSARSLCFSGSAEKKKKKKIMNTTGTCFLFLADKKANDFPAAASGLLRAGCISGGFVLRAQSGAGRVA